MAKTHEDILRMWPSLAEVARDIGQKPEKVRKWPQRGRIPPDYWQDLVEAGRKRGLPVTYEALAKSSRRPHA